MLALCVALFLVHFESLDTNIFRRTILKYIYSYKSRLNLDLIIG